MLPIPLHHPPFVIPQHAGRMFDWDALGRLEHIVVFVFVLPEESWGAPTIKEAALVGDTMKGERVAHRETGCQACSSAVGDADGIVFNGVRRRVFL